MEAAFFDFCQGVEDPYNPAKSEKAFKKGGIEAADRYDEDLVACYLDEVLRAKGLMPFYEVVTKKIRLDPSYTSWFVGIRYKDLVLNQVLTDLVDLTGPASLRDLNEIEALLGLSPTRHLQMMAVETKFMLSRAGGFASPV